MANTRSAKRRIKINERNRLRNRFYKSSVRTITKNFSKYLEAYSTSKMTEDELKEKLGLAYSLIDKGTKKNIFHKNTAAKKKSKLANSLKTCLKAG